MSASNEMSEKSEKFRSSFRTGSPVLPRPLVELLHRVSQLELKTKLRIFPALLVFIFSIVWLLQALVDRYFRLSWETRAVLLALQGAVLLFLFWKHVLVPLSQKLDRRKAALLIERKLPEFDSSLISVVEFCETPGGFPHHAQAVVRKLVDQVERRAMAPGLEGKVVDFTTTRKQERRAMAAAACLVLGIALAGLSLSWTLGKRILLSREPLPGDTSLIAMTGNFTVDVGTDATLTVRVLGVIPPVATLKISSSGGSATIPVNVTREGRDSFYSYTLKNAREEFTYRFEANDGESDTSKVTVNIPPHLEGIRFIQTYPEYTGLPETDMSPTNLRLLEGSFLRVEAKASEPLRSAFLSITDGEKLRMNPGEDKRSFSLDLTVPEKGWKSFSVPLDAGSSRKSSNEPVYRVDIIHDRPPTAAIMLPKKDRITVTPADKVKISYKVTDDFGISTLAIRYRVEEPAESFAEPYTGSVSPTLPKSEKSFSEERELVLSEIIPDLKIGNTIHLRIEAEDNNFSKGRRKASSKEKLITVISEQQKRMELLELMGQRAKEIEELYDHQREVNRKADESIRTSRKP